MKDIKIINRRIGLQFIVISIVFVYLLFINPFIINDFSGHFTTWQLLYRIIIIVLGIVYLIRLKKAWQRLLIVIFSFMIFFLYQYWHREFYEDKVWQARVETQNSLEHRDYR